jgi:UDP-glucose 4-epimerase
LFWKPTIVPKVPKTKTGAFADTMTVLVTGGAGYIGSHMVYALADRGEPLVVIDNMTTGYRPNLPDDVSLVIGDIGDQILVEKVMREHGVNAVVHFAGSIVVPDSVADPLGYYANNTVKSRTLMAAAVNCGVKHFIFSSTAAVYGMPDQPMIAEEAPNDPDFALWVIEADDRDDARRYRPCP